MAAWAPLLPRQVGPRSDQPPAFFAPPRLSQQPLDLWNDALPNLNRWQTAGSAWNVVGGQAFTTSGGAYSYAQRPVPLLPGQPFRYAARVRRPLNSGGGRFAQTAIYVTSDSVTTVNAGTQTRLLAIGFDEGTSAPNVRTWWIDNLGTAAFSSTGAINVGAGDWLLSIQGDETYITLCVVNADGTQEFRAYTTLASLGFVPQQVGFLNIDANTSTGSSIGPIGFRQGSLAPITPTTNLEDMPGGSGCFAGEAGGSGSNFAFRLGIPPGYNPAVGAPLVIYVHGFGGNPGEPADNPGMSPACRALMQQGWLVLSSQANGDAWGNQASINTVLAAWRWATQHYNVTSHILLCVSMGSMLGLLVAEGSIPFNGFMAFSPGINLLWAWRINQNPQLGQAGQASINAAYGLTGGEADFLTKTVGHDPMALPASSWGTIPILLSGSPRDEQADQSVNAWLLYNKLITSGVPGRDATNTFLHVAQGTHSAVNFMPPSVATAFAQGVRTGTFVNPSGSGAFPNPLDGETAPQAPPLPQRLGPRAVGPGFHFQQFVRNTAANTMSFSAGMSFAGSSNIGASKLLAGALSFTGNVARVISHGLGATLAFSGNLLRLIVHLMIAALSFSGAMIRAVIHTLAATLSFTGSMVRFTSKKITAGLSFTGAIPRAMTKGVTAALSFTGAMVKQTMRAFTAALSFTGAFATVKAKLATFTATLSFTGNKQLSTSHLLSAGLSFSGSLLRAIAHQLTAILSFSGSVLKRCARAFVAALSFTGAMVKSTTHKVTAALSFAGAMPKAITHTFTAALTFAGSMPRVIAKQAIAGLSFGGALVRSTRHTLAASLSFSGSFTSAKAVIKNLTATLSFSGGFLANIPHLKNLTATLSFSGAHSAIRPLIKLFTAALSFTGSKQLSIKHTMTAGLAFSGKLQRAIAHLFSASLAFSGRTTKQSSHALVASLSFVGKVTKNTVRKFTAAMPFAGSITRRTAKGISGALSFSTAMSRRMVHGMTAALRFSGSTSKRVARGLTATLTFTGTEGHVRIYHRAFTATISFSGQIVRRTNKALRSTLTFGGQVFRKIKQLYGRLWKPAMSHAYASTNEPFVVADSTHLIVNVDLDSPTLTIIDNDITVELPDWQFVLDESGSTPYLIAQPISHSGYVPMQEK